MKVIYLDHAAATPLDPLVQSAMKPYWVDQFYNPSAMYEAAQKVRNDIENARSAVAGCLGARQAEIVFTAGGTEANNLAIKGIMDAVIPKYPEARMLTSAIEHDSVLATSKQYEHDIVPVTIQGIVDVDVLRNTIGDQTALISVMYANNEIGTIQPIREIGHLIDEMRRDRRGRCIDMPLYFHTDAAQASNYLDLQVARLGVDLMTLNGGKIYGPKQSGVLYVRAGIQLRPIVYGGGQESNLRSGTENVPAIIGFAKALEIAQQSRHDESKRLAELQQYFYSEIRRRLPTGIINGSVKRRLPNNIHLTIPGYDNERLLYQLDDAGIQAAAGSACSASSQDPSHVLGAIGLSDDDARASLRFTMGRTTDKSELDHTLDILHRLTSL